MVGPRERTFDFTFRQRDQFAVEGLETFLHRTGAFCQESRTLTCGVMMMTIRPFDFRAGYRINSPPSIKQSHTSPFFRGCRLHYKYLSSAAALFIPSVVHSVFVFFFLDSFSSLPPPNSTWPSLAETQHPGVMWTLLKSLFPWPLSPLLLSDLGSRVWCRRKIG
jgi:hypothetical protein